MEVNASLVQTRAFGHNKDSTVYIHTCTRVYMYVYTMYQERMIENVREGA